MHAGDLDREITVEKKLITQDATFGTELVTWVPLALLSGSPQVAEKFAAQVQDTLPSRSESVTQGLSVARNQTRIRMRYRNDIDSSMRITVHGEPDLVYQIVGGPANIEGRKNFIEMVCERFSS